MKNKAQPRHPLPRAAAVGEDATRKKGKACRPAAAGLSASSKRNASGARPERGAADREGGYARVPDPGRGGAKGGVLGRRHGTATYAG